MPSVHKHPVKNFRPPPELYERAKAAVAAVDSDMNAHLVSYLRWLVGETDDLPARPERDLDHPESANWRIENDQEIDQRAQTAV